MVPVEISRLLIYEGADEQLVHLQEQGGDRYLPIVLGSLEAAALDRVLKQRQPVRPMTHSLFLEAVRQMRGRVLRAVIEDLREDTYFAKLVLRQQSRELYLDARPSDAIVLATMAEAPLFVADRVMNAAGEAL